MIFNAKYVPRRKIIVKFVRKEKTEICNTLVFVLKASMITQELQKIVKNAQDFAKIGIKLT